MSNAAKYLEAKQRMKVARDEANAIVKEAFADLAKEVFEAHPDLQSFGWKQYTPYFNDGDPCTFRCNTDYPSIRMGSWPDEDEDEFYSGDCYEGRGTERKLKSDLSAYQKAGLAVIDFLEKFEDDDYLSMFDDHQRVTVKRDGTIDVEEYSHD